MVLQKQEQCIKGRKHTNKYYREHHRVTSLLTTALSVGLSDYLSRLSVDIGIRIRIGIGMIIEN